MERGPKEKGGDDETVTGERRRPGRPPIHSEAWTKVTVVLFDRQIQFLDGLTATIRVKSGAGLSRAQVIRALIDAVNDAKLDLTASTSEAEVKAALVALLTR
jgi:hypothetical protein